MKIASYLYRRKSALLKGLVLGCTVWLTVTVLLFMEDRRISPASNNDLSAGGGGYQQQQQPVAAAQRLSAAMAAAVDDNQLLDDEFPLEGGVEQQPAAVVVREQQQQPSAARMSSKRSQAAVGLQIGEGVLPQPKRNKNDGAKTAYGEMGSPVVLPANLTDEIKKLVATGWQNNAFNQYVSDLISVHRSLPDPRDDW